MAELGEFLQTAHAVAGAKSREWCRTAANAVLAQCGIVILDRDNPLRTFSLADLAAQAASRAGFNVTGARGTMEIVAAAFMQSGSDFPTLLLDIGQGALLKGYDEMEETFPLWTSKGSLRDFKTGNRAGLSAFPTLDQIGDLGEYRRAVVTDQGEAVQLATFGKLFGVSRQAIVNDELGALTRLPRAMGRAAARTVGNLPYNVLTANANMADGVPLFHATHSNLLTGAAITTASVDAMAAAMAAQTSNGVKLNLKLKYLLVPVALEGVARAVSTAQFWVSESGFDMTRPNTMLGRFGVIGDPRLDADSASAWYGVADPDKTDTVEVSYLNGDDQPQVEQVKKFSADGGVFKIRIDCTAKALDWRGMAKNPGP